MERNQKVTLLFTDWQKRFWTRKRKAPYPTTDYGDLQGWEELSNKCPLLGIGDTS